MQEKPKSAEAHAAGDLSFALTIDAPWSDHNIWDSQILSILADEFLLLDFREAIGFTAKLGTLFDRTGFVQEPPPRLLAVRIHSERADQYESS
jgi:hypothetical protein